MQPILSVPGSFSFGRNKTYAYVDNIDITNVKSVVETSYNNFSPVQKDIQWLFELYRGKDIRILDNNKNSTINANYKAIVNYFALINDVKSGIFLQNDGILVNRSMNKALAKELKKVQDKQNLANIFARHKEAILHAAICGVGYTFIEPNLAYIYDKSVCPFNISILSPENVMLIYGDDSKEKPLATVYINRVPKGFIGGADFTGETIIPNLYNMANKYTVYTDTTKFTFFANEAYASGVKQSVITEPLPSYGCPITQYRLNSFMIGVAERVENLCHTLSVLTSNRVNNVEQIIQSILVIKNSGFPLGDSEEDEEKRQSFKKRLQELMMLMVEENNKDTQFNAQYISPQLSQSDVQNLYETVINDIISIAQIPQGVINIGGSGNTGAAQTASGWSNALVDAINSEPFVAESMLEELDKQIKILKKNDIIKNLSIEDIDIKFTRRSYENKTESSATFVTLTSNGVPFGRAAEISNLVTEPNLLEQEMLEWREQEEKRVENKSNIPMLDAKGEPMTEEIGVEKTENLMEENV